MRSNILTSFLAFTCALASAVAATPVTITPVTAQRGMVVAAHPQAASAEFARVLAFAQSSERGLAPGGR